jgi:DNA-binding beta-propeller fold protein YncE
MAIDKHNDLLIVDDQAVGYYVLVYAPGKTSPSQKIRINSGQPPADVAINRANTEIWVTSGFGGEVRGVSYPDGRLLDLIIRHRGWALGVAVSPASND